MSAGDSFSMAVYWGNNATGRLSLVVEWGGGKKKWMKWNERRMEKFIKDQRDSIPTIDKRGNGEKLLIAFSKGNMVNSGKVKQLRLIIIIIIINNVSIFTYSSGVWFAQEFINFPNICIPSFEGSGKTWNMECWGSRVLVFKTKRQFHPRKMSKLYSQNFFRIVLVSSIVWTVNLFHFVPLLRFQVCQTTTYCCNDILIHVPLARTSIWAQHLQMTFYAVVLYPVAHFYFVSLLFYTCSWTSL